MKFKFFYRLACEQKKLEPEVKMAHLARPVSKIIRVSLFNTTVLLIASFCSTRRDTFSKLYIEIVRRK